MATHYPGKSGNSQNLNPTNQITHSVFNEVKIKVKLFSRATFVNCEFIDCKFNIWFKLYRYLNKKGFNTRVIIKNCFFIDKNTNPFLN